MTSDTYDVKYIFEIAGRPCISPAKPAACSADLKVEEPVCDLWLLVAEIVPQQCFEGAGSIESSVLADSAGEETIH
jgi:hypothetical protein